MRPACRGVRSSMIRGTSQAGAPLTYNLVAACGRIRNLRISSTLQGGLRTVLASAIPGPGPLLAVSSKCRHTYRAAKRT